MERYNYYEAVKNDVLEALTDYDYADYDTLDDLCEALNDDLFACNGATGNASDSYYCNAWMAEEAIAHNWDLLEEALDAFGCDCNPLKDGAEACDATIRCYLLPWAIDEALSEIEDDFDAAHEDEA